MVDFFNMIIDMIIVGSYNNCAVRNNCAVKNMSLFA